MIQYLFAWLGYAKIPREVIVISIAQERFLEKLRDMYEERSEGGELFNYYIRNQKVLTDFLRSCRLISYGEEKKKK